jgi:hypothetical protein
LAAGIVLSVRLALSAQATDFTGWVSQSKITFNGYTKNEVLTNFPVLICLGTNSPSGFSYNQFLSGTNDDLRFADSNDTTALDYEIEKWDTNGISYVWVRVPTLASTNDFIYAHWGRSGQNALPCTTNGAVWMNGFAGVWHMNQTNAQDSTVNANHGMASAGVTKTNGIIDGADAFNGSGSIDCGNKTNLNVGYGTWEAWIYPSSFTDHAYHAVITKAYSSSWWFGLYNTGGQIQLWVANGAHQSTGAVGLNRWSHIAATWDGTTIRYYINGTLDSQNNGVTGLPVTGNAVTHIGADFSSGTSGALNYWFTGTQDEIRISGVCRSTNWVWASWSNQVLNSTFVGFGTAGAPSTNLLVNVLNATPVGATNVTLNGTLARDGGDSNTTVAFCWDTSDGGTNSGTSAWAYAVSLGTNWSKGQSFSTNVTGLLSGSTYVYRCYATNTTGFAWSSTQTFTTIYLPSVTNLGSIDTHTSNVLQAQVLDTGGNTPTTWFAYWADGSAVTTTVSKGTQTGAFSTVLTWLSPQTLYHYQAAASNLAGTSWSDVKDFTCQAVGWYVATNATSTYDGSSWSKAFTNVQSALNAAVDGDSIFMAGHTFVLTTQLVWNAKSLQVKGGYAATNDVSLPGARDASLWPTILRQTSTVQRVLVMNNVTNGLLESVTLTGGRAGSAYGVYQNPGDYGNPAYRRGGGLWVGNSVLTLANLIVTNNQTDAGGNDSGLGGGIFGAYGVVTVTNCLIAGNKATTGAGSSNGGGRGGGLFVYGGAWIVTDCVISNNIASQINNAGNLAGGLYLEGPTNRVVRTTICDNQVQGSSITPRYGGGVYLVSGELDRCVIIRNSMTVTTSASALGGGVYQSGGRIRNCLLTANSAYVDGGAIYTTGGTNESTTVADNTVSQPGGIAGVSLSGTTVTMTNCICVSNRRLVDNQEANLSATGGSVGYSAMTPLRTGTGNIVADVAFMNSTGGNYRLRPGSSGIDAGITQAWMTGATDLAETTRVQGSAPDMGAYETAPNNTGSLRVNFNADTTTGKDSLSVTFTASVAGSNTASLYYKWDFNGDGTADQEGSGLSSVSRSFMVGIYTIGLTVGNELFESNTLVKTAYIRVYPSTFYVWSGGSGGPGTNWMTAYTNLATALPYLSSNGTMCLAGETMAVTSSVVLSDYVGVTIRGGYEATNTAAVPGANDPVLWPTIIKRTAGSFRPMYLLNVTGFRLANVTITGGNMTNDTLDCKGGGLRIQNSSAVIEGCIFSNNVANAIGNGYGYGGGVYVINSVLILTNSLIASNRVATGWTSSNGRGDGGGLYLSGGTGTVVDCVISNNAVNIANNNGNWAGGLYLDGISNRVIRTRICNNQAQGRADTARRGGGVYLVNGELDRCIITQNGMTLTSSTDANGGGVYQTGGRIRNCLLYGNAGDQDGGAIYATAGTIESTTVSGNTVNEAGGIAGVLLSGSTVMTNCISVSNIRLADSQEANVSSSGGTVGYSASTPLRTGTSNTADAVVFMNAAGGDYRLHSGSAGIDTGITQVWMAAATDLAGTNRVLGNGPDMGAYETVLNTAMDVSFTGTPLNGKDSLSVTFTATVTNADPAGLWYKWDFNGDGSADQEGADLGTVTRTFSVGFFTIGLSVTNASGQSNSLVRSSYVSVYPSALYVWTGGSGGPGTNWSTAFTSLVAALPFVNSTSTLYLAGQTLAQTSAVSLSGFDSVTILGGYEATNPAAVPGAYDPAVWPTKIVRTSGTTRVMDLFGMTGFRMARVTVAGGNIPADLIKGVGGGIRIQSSSVVIEDCVISNNVANSGGDANAWGGGIYAINSTLIVRRSRFEKNSAVGSSYVNTCKGYGGAIASESSAVTIEACRFVTNNTDGKSSLSYGGALYLVGGTNQVRNSLFYGNQASVSGAQLGAGGAVYLNAGTLLNNCTIVSNQVRNTVLTIGGGVQHAGGGITNCIIYFNTTSNQPSDVGSANQSTIAYSCAPELTNAANFNITGDPLFAYTNAVDYHLKGESPCRNTGVVQPWMTGTTDLDGDRRVFNRQVDMGCYQSSGPRGTVFVIR